MFLRWAAHADTYDHLSNLFGASKAVVSDVLHAMVDSVFAALCMYLALTMNMQQALIPFEQRTHLTCRCLRCKPMLSTVFMPMRLRSQAIAGIGQ